MLYRLRAEQYEALAAVAERRAAERWLEELRAARQEGRRPRPIVRRKDASEVLRELLDGWMASGVPGGP